MASPEAGSVVERLRAFVKHNGYEIITGTSGRHAVPMDSEQASADLEALLAVVEAAKEVVGREARSEYSSIYAAPGEFASVLRDALDALYAPDSAETP